MYFEEANTFLKVYTERNTMNSSLKWRYINKKTNELFRSIKTPWINMTISFPNHLTKGCKDSTFIKIANAIIVLTCHQHSCTYLIGCLTEKRAMHSKVFKTCVMF